MPRSIDARHPGRMPAVTSPHALLEVAFSQPRDSSD